MSIIIHQQANIALNLNDKYGESMMKKLLISISTLLLIGLFGSSAQAVVSGGCPPGSTVHNLTVNGIPSNLPGVKVRLKRMINGRVETSNVICIKRNTEICIPDQRAARGFVPAGFMANNNNMQNVTLSVGVCPGTGTGCLYANQQTTFTLMPSKQIPTMLVASPDNQSVSIKDPIQRLQSRAMMSGDPKMQVSCIPTGAPVAIRYR